VVFWEGEVRSCVGHCWADGILHELCCGADISINMLKLHPILNIVPKTNLPVLIQRLQTTANPPHIHLPVILLNPGHKLDPYFRKQ
jgi:hypothetical protein